MSAGAIGSGRDLGSDATLSTDVVVVGSGAGGSVIATELAEAGFSVVVVEEGPHVKPAQYAKMRPSESIRTMWRDGAFTVAWGLGKSPMVNVTMGRCIGGSSALTGGVCFRPPQVVHDQWTGERGLKSLTAGEMAPYFEAVEKNINVTEVPASMRSRGIQLFGEGAEKLGFALKPIKRNTVDCNGCGRCNFGCPCGAKRSVDVSYLPRAVASGAQVLSDCLVEKVLLDGDRATGVSGRVLSPIGKPLRGFTVHAKRVVVAAGAYHTPVLLQRSGLGKGLRQIGRNMTLHPSFRMLGRFEEEVRGWQGALQPAFAEHPEHEHLTMVGLYVPPSVLGATMPGFGPEHVERARRIPHLAMFGGLIHDEGGGVVKPGFGREPRATFRMAKQERAAVPRALRIMAETFRAAGAKEIFLPLLGLEPLNVDRFDEFDFARVPMRRLECASQHPLGTCRMGTNPDHSVVDEDAKVWGVKELFIGDGAVIPTSLGVNPQETVMTMATRTAWKLRERRFS